MDAVQIIATGKALPKKLVTNDDMSKIVDTSDEWISTRTGIRQRHFCDGEKNWELACQAAKHALEKGGIEKEQIGAVIVGTATPDYIMPSMACIIQEELGLPEDIPAFDINAACSGFIYALRVAGSLLQEEARPYALVLGSEQLSTRTDMTDRSTCVLFGDGAGAVIIKRNTEKKFYGVWGTVGNRASLGCPGHVMGDPYIYMDGQTVFRFATQYMSNAVKQVLEKAELTLEDVDYVVCHQANERIIEYVRKQFKAPAEKFFKNIGKYGNTSAASIPIALTEMDEQGLLEPGKKVVIVGFGAGFTWGSMLLEF
ncbi:MAG: ketoacyl-ACP synthase III [Lachnospiraceae bacterium]|nr:ketoacyl-ACP synthase III [Lachnospiraceae bacterium]MBP3611002.1 ketoacyl-ACP synthase III [Lachnospiraceae bacterium]